MKALTRLLALTSLGVALSIPAYAINVQLQFTNDTDLPLHPMATITYDQNGTTHWNEPIQPPVTYIPAHAQNMPADQPRTNLDDYFLEYFELFNEQNKYVTNCLESYVAIDKSAIITFRLKQMGKVNPHYYCSYEVKYT